jgi:hypothetical protein
MARTQVQSELIATNAISGTIIADNAITATHIAQNSISGILIPDSGITTTMIAANNITAAKIVTGAVANRHLASTVISSQSAVTAASGDYVLIGDTSDSNNLKKALVSDLGNSLANDANNRVITGTGSGLNGEANLTFDGSTLAVTGAATVSTTLGVTGETTLSTHLNMGDSDIIKLGVDADLQITHDGSDSTIIDSGTGNLLIGSNSFYLRNAANNETMLRADENSYVKLYYDNAEKLATTSGGVDITGTLGVTGATTFNEDVTITKSSGDVTLLLYASENSGSREPALQLKGYSTNSNPIIQFGDNVGFPGGIEYENQDNSMMLHTNGAVALTLSSAQLATFAGAVTVTGVTTIANTSAANVNNESHILIRNLANGNIVTDGLTYNCAEDKLGVGTNLFLAGGYIRSGAADLGFGTASQGQIIALSNTNGSVGIGDTSPSTAYSRQLQIHAAGTGSSLHLTDNSTGSTNSDGFHILTYGGVCYLINRENDAMIFLNNGTEHFRIAAGGDLTATDTSIGSNSDSRLKTNIESYTYDISKFKSYSPKKFDWINPEQHGDRSQQIGFIAQEQEIIDERFIGSTVIDAVAGVEDNPDVSLLDADKIVKTSKFGQMDAMYISVIQQLITRLEAAEAKIVTLEG